MKSIINKITIFSVISLSLFLLGGFVLADENRNLNAPDVSSSPVFADFDNNAIDKATTTIAFGGNFKLFAGAGMLKNATQLEINKISNDDNFPWQLDIASDIYQYDFINKESFTASTSINIDIKYNIKTNNYKQIFFYDNNLKSWRPLPTKDFPDEMTAKAQTNLSFARVAVFDYPFVLTSGKASWYKYKGGNYAASPDFPIGSRLRVYNLSNNKFVDVAVNDYGPERNLHPDRVVDLDKKAFSQIASLSAGIINVRIEPIYIKPFNGKALNVSTTTGLTKDINLTSKSAVIMDEASGEIIFQKNATTTLPLASLSKIIAVKVFLDTKPKLNKIVYYSKKDEEYNYLYANKWESARLKVGDNEKMTIEDLIYSALVGSANNAVESLVRLSGLARDEFILNMNKTAKNWGALNTFFIEPTGLSPKNVSSAMDYAIITKEAMGYPLIEKISKSPLYKFYSYNKKNKKILHKINNSNKLVGKNLYHIAGSKTGYLNEAGYCLMTRVKAKNGNNLIVVTMGTPVRKNSFSETEELIKYGLRKIK